MTAPFGSTSTKNRTTQLVLDEANPNDLANALSALKLGTVFAPLKRAFTGLTAASASLQLDLTGVDKRHFVQLGPEQLDLASLPAAPTIAPDGASGDVFTIGRTLAVLAMEFRGYQSTFVSSLPAVEDTPLFQQHDSLYRVLAKATALSPDDGLVNVQAPSVVQSIAPAGDTLHAVSLMG